MKIGSHIKPRSGKARHVTLHGTQYAFEPLKDKQGVIHFVADVTDADHAALLMENGAFYAFDPAKAVQPKLKQAGSGEPPPQNDAQAWPAAVLDEANALLDAPAQDIATAISKVSGIDVVRAAVEIEAANKNRKTVLALLDATIEGMTQAGVTG